jgi:thioredoxin 1
LCEIKFNNQTTNPMKFLSLFFISCMLIGITACAQKAPSKCIKVLAVADYKAKLTATPNAQLIDLRTPAEIVGGKLDGSQNIVFGSNDFLAQFEKLDKTKPVFVYCAKGGRSGKTTPQLEQMGFTEIYDLEGGYDAWKVAK